MKWFYGILLLQLFFEYFLRFNRLELSVQYWLFICDQLWEKHGDNISVTVTEGFCDTFQDIVLNKLSFASQYDAFW